MAEWRLRGIPPALWRRVRDKATREGADLRAVLLGLMERYSDGTLDAPPVHCDRCGVQIGLPGASIYQPIVRYGNLDRYLHGRYCAACCPDTIDKRPAVAPDVKPRNP